MMEKPKTNFERLEKAFSDYQDIMGCSPFDIDKTQTGRASINPATFDAELPTEAEQLLHIRTVESLVEGMRFARDKWEKEMRLIKQMLESNDFPNLGEQSFQRRPR